MAKRTKSTQPTQSFRDRIKELRRVRAGDLVPNESNWRTHPKAQQDALRGVLAEIGYADACLARELPDGRLSIIDGHLRRDLDPEQILPVLVLDVDEAEAKKLLLTLDPLAAMAEANNDALAALLREVDTGSQAVADLISALGKQHGVVVDEAGNVNAEPQVDRAGELANQWKTARGQVWEIRGKAGTHRLMCGDSTKAEDVATLMGDVRAGLMNTDPPYGVGYDNADRPNPGVAKPRVAKPRVAKPRVANDALQNSELQAFLEAAFRAAVDKALTKNAAWYLWHAHFTQGFFAAAAAAAAAVILHRQIIWVKSNMLLTRGQYHWKHEPCFMGWVKGNQPPDYGEGNGERTQTTVWEIQNISNADRKEYNHATPKPIGIFTVPLVKHLRPGEVCYEPFAGSGPQFIAAENLGRICHGMEIEPKYVAVILQRCKDIGMEPRLAAQ